MSDRASPRRTPWRPPSGLVWSWLALLTLLAMTTFVAYVPISPFNTPVALLIAVSKAALVAIVFMELREHRGLVVVFAMAGFFWLGVMLWLTLADFLTRPALPPFGSLF